MEYRTAEKDPFVSIFWGLGFLILGFILFVIFVLIPSYEANEERCKNKYGEEYSYSARTGACDLRP